MYIVGGKTLCHTYEQAQKLAGEIFDRFKIVASIERVEQ